MASYLLLGNYTEQGMRAIQETASRADAVKALGEQCGVSVREMFWTSGPYDVACFLEASDEESVNALTLKLGTLGNVRTTLLRAFSRPEMEGILGKMPG